MKTKPVTGVLAATLAMALAGSASAATLGAGHITVGSPTTSLLALDNGIDGFVLDGAVPGSTISTSTVDNGGLGHDLDLYFYDSSGRYVASCATDAADESCTVPDGASSVEVDAFFGRDLDVTVDQVAPA